MKAFIRLPLFVFILGLLFAYVIAAPMVAPEAISAAPAHTRTPAPAHTRTPAPGHQHATPEPTSSASGTEAVSGTITLAAPGLASPPHGLTAVNNTNSAEVGSPFDDQTYANPNIAGLTFQTSWADIEPTEGNFVWDKLDTLFDSAEKNNKWVELDLIPGFSSPQWALQGVQTATFNVTYGPADTEAKLLPLPWDQTYLTRWFAFLQAVSTRYGNRPSFIKIGADGPTGLTSEMALPNADADLCTWLGAGYTSDQLVAAWKQVFAQYAQIFPNQYFSLALSAALPIVSTTQCTGGTLTGPDPSESQRVASAIIDLGVTNYPKQFVLQQDELSAANETAADPTYYNFVRDYNGKVVTGFEFTTSAMQQPADMGAPGGVNALRKSLQYGVDGHAQFIEIHEADVLASGAQTVLASFASKLTPSS